MAFTLPGVLVLVEVEKTSRSSNACATMMDEFAA